MGDPDVTDPIVFEVRHGRPVPSVPGAGGRLYTAREVAHLFGGDEDGWLRRWEQHFDPPGGPAPLFVVDGGRPVPLARGELPPPGRSVYTADELTGGDDSRPAIPHLVAREWSYSELLALHASGGSAASDDAAPAAAAAEPAASPTVGDARRLRFHMVGRQPVPLGPGESPPAGSDAMTVAQVQRRCRRWSAADLTALWSASFGSAADADLEQRRQPWRDAIADPAVWPRLAFHAAEIGTVPPAVFLLALLQDWNSLDADAHRESLLDALGVPEEASTYAGPGKGADDAT